MLNFKELRKKKNLTQKEFCELIGVSLRALSNYENGNIDITLKKVQEIADILEVDFCELFEKKKLKFNNPQEPTEIYGKTEKIELDLLLKNNSLLKEQNQLQEEVIIMLREKVKFFEEKYNDCENQKKLLETSKKMD